MTSLWSWLQSQFATLHYPDEDCTGKTIIVTGSNVGLGLEAARHFVQLNAAKVILACRSTDRADAAKQDIENSTKRMGVVEVWQLDLSSYENVKQFAARADQLDRLDVLVNNASLMDQKWAMMEGHESHVAVNVLGTFLLTILMLPVLRRSGTRHNITPCISIVASDAAHLALFRERKADNIMHALDTDSTWIRERYNTTKLLQLMLMKKLTATSDASGKGHVAINALNPGLCKTQLYRQLAWPISAIMNGVLAMIGRDAEMGSRTLVAAALAGDRTHGQYLTDYAVKHVWPGYMTGEEGERLTQKVWDEVGEVLNGVEPGLMEKI